MKDNFSHQSELYLKFRPSYPQAVIDFILNHTDSRGLALDIGTGNGQLAVQLSPYFNRIEATDISSLQLENAIPKSNIHYSQQSAEKTNFPDQQFDLIIAAQAAHWFNFEQFYPEVNRLIKYKGTIALLGYGLIEINPEIDRIINRLYTDVLGNYWDAERKYIDEEYQTIPFPYTNKIYQKFENTYTWNFEQLIGYLNTWSAVKHYQKKNGTNPISIISEELKSKYKEIEYTINFPIFLLLSSNDRLEQIQFQN